MGHLDCSAAKRAQSDRPAVCDSLLPPVLCAHNPRAAAANVTHRHSSAAQNCGNYGLSATDLALAGGPARCWPHFEAQRGFFGTPRGLHIATTEIWLVFQVESAATAFSNASIADPEHVGIAPSNLYAVEAYVA
jgi:hypothetical protein